MRKTRLIIVACILSLSAAAQQVYTYTGEKVSLSKHTFTSRCLGKLQGVAGQAYQGLDVWQDYAVSLQNTGYATIYRLDGSTGLNVVSQFPLGSNSKYNHANVASFSNQYYSPGDKFPLLLVSQSYKQAVDGKKDLLYVERISNDMKKSQLVATINFVDSGHLCGYAVQWVYDHENDMLYGFANTRSNLDSLNQHRILKFRMPRLTGLPLGAEVKLTASGLLENYLVEETFPHYYMQIGQGLMIKDGLLYMPVGLGTPPHPSILYVWDLTRHVMRNAIDMSQATSGELEDCAEHDGKLIMQSQGALYEITF